MPRLVLVLGLIASLLSAKVRLVILNLPLIGLWVGLLTTPKPGLYPGVLVFAALGCTGANPSPAGLTMLLILGPTG